MVPCQECQIVRELAREVGESIIYNMGPVHMEPADDVRNHGDSEVEWSSAKTREVKESDHTLTVTAELVIRIVNATSPAEVAVSV